MIATSPRRLEANVAVGVDLGDRRVGRVVIADGGHVADRLVGAVHEDDDLLGAGRCIEHARLGQDLERDSRRGARDRPWPPP